MNQVILYKASFYKANQHRANLKSPDLKRANLFNALSFKALLDSADLMMGVQYCDTILPSRKPTF